MGKESDQRGRRPDAVVLGAVILDKKGISLAGVVGADDKETADFAWEAFTLIVEDEIFGDEEHYVDVDRSPADKKQFFFSAENWKAPWQPKGPNPPWRNKEGAIN